MDTRFTKEQEMLRKSAREFLKMECPIDVVRELEENEKGYDPKIWKKIANLEWTGLIIPEEYGGMGMTFQDLTIILEEMGRNIFPSPFLPTMISAFLIIEVGNEEQKKKFLPKIARGEVIITPAFFENSGELNYADILTWSRFNQNNYLITGTKLFVEMANIADYFICPAITYGSNSSPEGVSLFLIDAKDPGIEYEVMPSIALNKLCEVRFKDAVVPDANILGELGKGWPVVERAVKKGAIAKCAESIGAIQACVDMTVQYCKDRVQYNRPIGAFQAIQHRLSEMWISMQTSKYLFYEKAWKESEGLSCDKDIATVKSYINEAYKFVTKWAVRLHGAIGTTREHNISLYYRRAKEADCSFGNTAFHRKTVAKEINLL